MPILIDGNNLLHNLPHAQRSRAAVRRHVLDSTRHESMSVTVVFDGPPPSGAPQREVLGKVTVIYSGARTADDVIVGMLPPGAQAKQWSVITDDRGLADRVRDRGANVRRLADWRSRGKAPPRKKSYESKLSSHDIADWEQFFSDVERDDDQV